LVRFVLTMLLWVVTTIGLAAAVVATWAQRNIVDGDGYAALARSAAHDGELQDAVASELTMQVVANSRNHGVDVTESAVRRIADLYTASHAFPGQFGQANRIAHQWPFTDSVRRTADGWVIDLQPMLSDPSTRQLLDNLNVAVPSEATVPVTATGNLRPGELRPVAVWGPWVSIGSAVLAGILALLTLASARRRGKALSALGVSALIVGGGGWAGLEVARGRIGDVLNHTTGDMRRIAEVMVAQAQNSLHVWLNLTLAAGAALVVLGVLVTMVGGLWRAA
jgi:hypothetical protein